MNDVTQMTPEQFSDAIHTEDRVMKDLKILTQHYLEKCNTLLGHLYFAAQMDVQGKKVIINVRPFDPEEE